MEHEEGMRLFDLRLMLLSVRPGLKEILLSLHAHGCCVRNYSVKFWCGFLKDLEQVTFTPSVSAKNFDRAENTIDQSNLAILVMCMPSSFKKRLDIWMERYGH